MEKLLTQEISLIGWSHLSNQCGNVHVKKPGSFDFSPHCEGLALTRTHNS